MHQSAKILVFGHRGLVGSALQRYLHREGYSNVTFPEPGIDLRNQAATQKYFANTRPEYVFMAAGRVGGIVANSSLPYDFIYDNLIMAGNVVECCRQNGVKKLMMLGSTCIYPRMAPQPLREESLLDGPLEPTNQWYAVAKIAGVKLGQAARRQHGMDVISAMPTNLYGPNDNFHPQYSHVLPALLRRFHEAKEQHLPSVTLWGTGTPRREFLHVDDLASALVLMMRQYSSEEIVNVGCGQDVSIAELAEILREVVGYQGEIVYDNTKPDGTPRKQTAIDRISALGWAPKIGLREGLADTYAWYLKNPQLSSLTHH